MNVILEKIPGKLQKQIDDRIKALDKNFRLFQDYCIVCLINILKKKNPQKRAKETTAAINTIRI